MQLVNEWAYAPGLAKYLFINCFCAWFGPKGHGSHFYLEIIGMRVIQDKTVSSNGSPLIKGTLGTEII